MDVINTTIGRRFAVDVEPNQNPNDKSWNSRINIFGASVAFDENGTPL